MQTQPSVVKSTVSSIEQALVQTGPTAPNPTKPVVVTVIGLVVGVLSMVQAYFGSGHIPTAAEVSGILAGAGVSLGSVIAFLAHHLGVNKAMLMRDASLVMSARPRVAIPMTTAPAPTPAVAPNPTPGSAS